MDSEPRTLSTTLVMILRRTWNGIRNDHISLSCCTIVNARVKSIVGAGRKASEWRSNVGRLQNEFFGLWYKAIGGHVDTIARLGMGTYSSLMVQLSMIEPQTMWSLSFDVWMHDTCTIASTLVHLRNCHEEAMNPYVRMAISI